MQRLEVSGAVRSLYSSLGFKGLKVLLFSLERNARNGNKSCYRVPIAILLGLSNRAIAARHLQATINTITGSQSTPSISST